MSLILVSDGGGWRVRLEQSEVSPRPSWPCAIGWGGLVRGKREGDGGTPVGSWPMRRVLYRPDRMEPPETVLPVMALKAKDGWCDDPGDPAYNRAVTLPYPAGHEVMWRDDHLYDIVVVLGHNDDPPKPGGGSAIFMHVAAPEYAPTAGCVALALPDLREALASLPEDAVLRVPSPATDQP